MFLKNEDPLITKMTSIMTVELYKMRDILARKKLSRSRREVIQTTMLNLLAIYWDHVVDGDDVQKELVERCQEPALTLIALAFNHKEHDKKLGKQYPSPRFSNRVWDAMYAIDDLITSKDGEVIRRFYNSLGNVYG